MSSVYTSDAIIATISVYISHAVGGILTPHNLEDLKDILLRLEIYDDAIYTSLRGKTHTYKLLCSISGATFWRKLGQMTTLNDAVVNMKAWLETKFDRERVLESRIEGILNKYTSDNINLFEYVERGGFKEYSEIRLNERYNIDDAYKTSSAMWCIFERDMMKRMGTGHNPLWNIDYQVVRERQSQQVAQPEELSLLMSFAGSGAVDFEKDRRGPKGKRPDGTRQRRRNNGERGTQKARSNLVNKKRQTVQPANNNGNNPMTQQAK